MADGAGWGEMKEVAAGGRVSLELSSLRRGGAVTRQEEDEDGEEKKIKCSQKPKHTRAVDTQDPSENKKLKVTVLASQRPKVSNRHRDDPPWEQPASGSIPELLV